MGISLHGHQPVTGFEPAQRGHIRHYATRSNHSAIGQGQHLEI